MRFIRTIGWILCHPIRFLVILEYHVLPFVSAVMFLMTRGARKGDSFQEVTALKFSENAERIMDHFDYAADQLMAALRRGEEGDVLVEQVEFVPAILAMQMLDFERLNTDEVQAPAMVLFRELGGDRAPLGEEHMWWVHNHQDQIPPDVESGGLLFPGSLWRGLDGRYGINCLRYFDGHWHIGIVAIDLTLEGEWHVVRLRHPTLSVVGNPRRSRA